MAARPTWKGYLKVSLVTIPVRVYPGDRVERHDLASTSSTPSARPRSSRRSGARTASARSPPPRSSRATSSRRAAGWWWTRRTSPRSRPSRPAIINLMQFTDADAIDPMYVDKRLLPGARRADGRRRLRGDARGHAGQGRHRQGGALRPRVPGRRQAAQAGPGDVHAAPRRRDPHASTRSTSCARCRGKVKPGRGEARQAGDRDLRGRARPRRLHRRVPGGPARRSSTPRSPARRSSAPEEEAPPKVVDLMEALRRSLDQVSGGKKKTCQGRGAGAAKGAEGPEATEGCR